MPGQARPRGSHRGPALYPDSPQHSPLSFPGLPFAITSEGLEQTFTTNYLGPFLLTNLLLGEWRGWGEFRGLWGLLPAHPLLCTDLLKASAPARVVNVSSFRHSLGTADSAFLTGQRSPGGYDAAYNSTKLMNVLFTAELARRLQGTGGYRAVPGSAVPCGTPGTSPVPTPCAPVPGKSDTG